MTPRPDADAAARRCYVRYAAQHRRFAAALTGIDDAGERDWYAALLMNRLLFLTLLRRRGDLEGALRPEGFHGYYRDVLLPRFRDDGPFGTHERDDDPRVQVPDAAYAELFAAFDACGDDLTPDVLGHVFEQVVNRRHGAYYTKDDVTGYVVAATVGALFLDRLVAHTHADPWGLLARHPGRYLPESLTHGVTEPLPDAVRAAQPGDHVLDARADAGHGLPGETWWETLHRHRRARDLRAGLAGGAVRTADDAVTANVDLVTLALDSIDTLQEPGDIATARELLTQLRIVDPTCGSGAFLVAALRLLQELGDAVTNAARTHAVPGIHDLRTAAAHCLHGIDLVPEAAEIARLRIHLALTGDGTGDPPPDLKRTITVGNLVTDSTAATFDVVIGNPPYEPPASVPYDTGGHRTSDAPDIYAVCMERAAALLRDDGRYGLVVMASLCYGREYATLRDLLTERFPRRWVSSYARIPQGLFTHDARVRTSIVLGAGTPGDPPRLHTTRLRRWEAAYRPHLLRLTEYNEVAEGPPGPWPFLGAPAVVRAMRSARSTLGDATTLVRAADPYATDPVTGGSTPDGPFALNFKTTAYNYLQVFVDIPPREDDDGRPLRQTKLATLWFPEEEHRDLAFTLLASRWAFAWWTTYGDDFDVTAGLLRSIPVDLAEVHDRENLLRLAKSLRQAQTGNLRWKRNKGRTGRWHLPGCRDVLDEIDAAWAHHFGAAHLLDDLALAYWSTVRTGAGSDEAAGPRSG